jgi:phosphate transport system substrate-binding protein
LLVHPEFTRRWRWLHRFVAAASTGVHTVSGIASELLPPTRTDRLRSAALVLGVLAIFALVAGLADGDTPAASPSPSVTGSAVPTSSAGGVLEGEFLVSGSSTVFPIVLRQAEEFADVAPGVAIAVEGPGSGDGARKFCAGEVPIANASRLFKDSEVAECAAAGIEFIELRRGIDGISVITSPKNDAVECVSFNDLYALLSEEAQGFGSWADANALTSLWGGQAFPDVALDVYGPGEESGTFDSFTEIVIDGVAGGKTGLDVQARDFSEAIRPDYTSSPDDNVIIEGVTNSTYSLAWIGYSYAQQAADNGRVKLLAVSKADGGPCVLPSPETIASAEFPISRFLYTYVNAEAAASDPAVAAFVDYMLSDEGLAAVSAVGYVDLADADQRRTQTIWKNRVTGRSW